MQMFYSIGKLMVVVCWTLILGKIWKFLVYCSLLMNYLVLGKIWWLIQQFTVSRTTQSYQHIDYWRKTGMLCLRARHHAHTFVGNKWCFSKFWCSLFVTFFMWLCRYYFSVYYSWGYPSSYYRDFTVWYMQFLVNVLHWFV
jgi:hypothetical protein